MQARYTVMRQNLSNWLRRLVAGTATRAARQRPGRRARPRVEALEDRLAPAVTAFLLGSQLEVNLSAANDHARVSTAGGNLEVVDDDASTTVFSTSTASVTSINAQGTDADGQQVVLDGV